MKNKQKMKIAVVCGGLSNERDVSVKTGRQVFKNLDNEKYDKCLIEITEDGKWMLRGNSLETGIDAVEKSLTIMHPDCGIAKNDLKDYDVIFLALHGKFGEDGKIQSILDILGVTYTGSGVLASALGMNKAKTSEFIKGLKIKAPKFIFLSGNNNVDLHALDKKIKEEIKYPCVVKPNESGSSIGINIAKTFEDLEKAIIEARSEDDEILIEEYIRGREITCGVLGNSNKTKLDALPPVEIIAENTFFDYDAKYFSEKTREICPAEISKEHAKKIMELSKKIHFALGCCGLTRSDFILKDDEFYFLEINTLPGLTEQSLCPKEAKAAGMKFSEFLDKQIKLALIKNL